jgi:ABC-2 type transport system permease protein
MSSARIVRLVAAREVTVRLASKALRITTVVLLVALIVIIDLTGGGSSAQKVGLTPPVASLSEPLQAAAPASGDEVRTPRVANATAGADQVRHGDPDALVTGRPNRIAVVVDQELDAVMRTGARVRVTDALRAG